MANFNMTAIQKIVNELELTAQLIPSATNPRNCSKILVNGKELKSSQWTKAEAYAELSAIKDGSCSVKQLDNFMAGMENFGNNIKDLIDFSQPIGYVMKDYMDLQESSYREFDNTYTYKYDTWVNMLENDMNLVRRLIDSKEVYNINGFIYSNVELINCMKHFAEAHNLKKSNEELQQAVNNFVSYVNR